MLHKGCHFFHFRLLVFTTGQGRYLKLALIGGSTGLRRAGHPQIFLSVAFSTKPAVKVILHNIIFPWFNKLLRTVRFFFILLFEKKTRKLPLDWRGVELSGTILYITFRSFREHANWDCGWAVSTDDSRRTHCFFRTQVNKVQKNAK